MMNQGLTGNEAVYLEQLKYLKEISDQQKILSRAESILERSFETVQECNGLIDRCKNDVERLKEERKKLLERVKEIDEDLIKLSEVTASLEEESALQCSSAPLADYASLFSATNSRRSIGQLPPLKECHAYSELQKHGLKSPTSKRPLPMPPSSVIKEAKAGKSLKQCPFCFKQVSRNAITCPHCKSVCSKKTRDKKW